MRWRSWVRTHRLYALRHVARLERLVEQSIQHIREFYAARGDVLALSYSGGKDSTLLWHLAKEAGVPFIALWFADTPIPGSLDMMTQHGVKLVHHRTWYHEFKSRYGVYPVWGRRPAMDLVIDEQRELDRIWSIRGTLVGMRRAESVVRRYALVDVTRPVQDYGGGWRCAPLAAWRNEDVWAYTIDRGLPVHPHYERMCNLGVDEHRLRIGGIPSLFCSEMPAEEAVLLMKRLYPAAIAEFLHDNPQVVSR